VLSLCTSNPQTKALMVWRERPRRITLPIPSTTKKFLLLFSQPFHAQGALDSTIKLQNVSLE
jgi:hypothetical protein